MTIVFALFAATLFLAYSNYANDNFKGVATLYGSNLCGGQRAKDSFELSQFSRVAPWLMILIGR